VPLSERSLYKNYRSDRNSDEDYEPKVAPKKEVAMSFDSGKNTEGRGMGNSKHAVEVEVKGTPKVNRETRFRVKEQIKMESINETLIEQLQLVVLSTVPYGGSSMDNALMEAISEMESGQLVPVVTEDKMNEEEDIVESILSDDDRIVGLEDIVKKQYHAMKRLEEA